MTTDTKTNQAMSPGILLTEINRLQTFGILLTHILVPLLALTALVSTNTSSLHVFIQILTLAVIETLVMIASYSLLIQRFGLRVPHSISLFLYVLLTVYWFWGLNGDTVLYVLLTGFIGTVLWRIQKIGRSESLAETNRTAFMVDTVAVFLLSIYFYVWALPIGGAVPTDVSPLFAFVLLIWVLLHTFALWRVERLTFNTRATTPPWVVWISLAIVFIAVIGMHHWLFQLLQFAGVGLISLLQPILYHLPFPSIHWHLHLHRPATLVSAASKLPNKQHHQVVMPVLLWIFMILVAAVIVGLVY